MTRIELQCEKLHEKNVRVFVCTNFYTLNVKEVASCCVYKYVRKSFLIWRVRRDQTHFYMLGVSLFCASRPELTLGYLLSEGIAVERRVSARAYTRFIPISFRNIDKVENEINVIWSFKARSDVAVPGSFIMSGSIIKHFFSIVLFRLHFPPPTRQLSSFPWIRHTFIMAQIERRC